MMEGIEETIENIWTTIEEKIKRGGYADRRVYQRLDLEKETGIRLGVVAPGNVRELLIQLAPTDKADFAPPKWVGMRFEIILLDVPDKGTRHIRLYLDRAEHRSVFTMVCGDIVDTLLEVVKPEHRTVQLLACLEKWNRFFRKHGVGGLSNEGQRGLFGEISWLRKLLNSGMDLLKAVESWQGCRRGYHDFEFDKTIVEVKTTISKEPREVRINNERQLDDRGFEKMFLYVLSLHPALSKGQKLPELINEVRSSLSSNLAAKELFEQSLRDAGYLDVHAILYDTGYIVKTEEAFQVRKGFPRIIDLPPGTGNISYSLTISACSEFLTDLDSTINAFSGGE
jgi:hypothetical protein